ncbi:MAG: glycosyltransferase family 2 protein [Gammaproteobacteria bacterium]|nr:glycosyltransferase family 2 protein [Gammaproteobacteria bacterium]MCH9743682.1 glycosyltransferase family 2 protein [Gammaproteobacteria bacterium]
MEITEQIHDPKIAVLLPCYNEAIAISEVVQAFKQVLPYGDVYVYDNNSTDNTASVAKTAGAIVRYESQQGKGNVVRRMFADIEADIYVMCDGDMTYDIASTPKLIGTLISEKLAMVVGTRKRTNEATAYRWGHRLGNALFTKTISFLFKRKLNDVLSGFRVFSRRFVKSYAALANGFDVEVELTLHSLELGLPIAEVETPYFTRPEGSFSKLHKYKDGMVILKRVLLMFKEARPLLFFSCIALLFVLLSFALSVPMFRLFFMTGVLSKIPTAVLCTGIMILGVISFVCGVILDGVSRSRKEFKYLRYLSADATSSNKQVKKEFLTEFLV